MMDRESRIFIAGHRGLVGSALLRRLQAEAYANLITQSRAELDLTNQNAVEQFFVAQQPEYVILAAAKVGGILANSVYAADFIRDNLLIQTHVIDAAWRHGVKKLLFLGSSCIYPKFSPQPIKEEYLLTASLEPTNEPYAIAKIAGIKLCQSYRRQFGFNAICAMPTNLYGPGDRFDPLDSHVLPALIRKFDEAKESGAPQVIVWGTGTPRREFLYVDDLADACLSLMRGYDSPEIINVGVGEDISIGDLAALIAEIVGYSGEVVYDTTKPDGTPQKLLEVRRLHALGWHPRVSLREGIQRTYRWYLQHVAEPHHAEVKVVNYKDLLLRDNATDSRLPDHLAPNRGLEERFHWELYSGLQQLRGRPVAACLRQFQAWEQLDPEAQHRLAQARLVDALAFARARVPFYSTGPWQAALARSDPADIRAWPVLDRATVEEHAPEFIARPAPRGLSFRTTSGSTGRPLRFAVEPLSRAWDLAAMFRVWLWHDLSPATRTLRLFTRSDGAFHDWVLNRKIISAIELTPERLELIVRVLMTWRPTVLWSFPSAAFLLAQHIRQTRPSTTLPVVPYVLLGGEQVFPFQRRGIERHLGGRVMESYGASDTAIVASECPAGSMHILVDHIYLEILRDGEPVPPGEVGDIVVTRLVNRAMPLVRYRLGDQGAVSPEPCPCGRPLPVLVKLRGRSKDLLVSADGRSVHGSALTAGLDDIFFSVPAHAVRQVLFEQLDQRAWRVLVETAEGVNETIAVRLVDLVRRHFGTECAVTIERVTTIPREPSGKFRYYRSLVSNARRGLPYSPDAALPGAKRGM